MKRPKYPKEFVLRLLDKTFGPKTELGLRLGNSHDPSSSALATSIALLLGKPDREIWEKVPNKEVYARAAVMYLSETGGEKTLEGFLKDPEVMTLMDIQILESVLSSNPGLKRALATHYLGTYTKEEIREKQKTGGFFNVNIQNMLIGIILEERGPYGKIAEEYEKEDKTLTLPALHDRLEKILEIQIKTITPPNINSLRVGDWLRRSSFGLKDKLSTLLGTKIPVDKDGDILAIYYVEIGKTENTVELYPGAFIRFTSLMQSKSYFSRKKQMMVFKEFVRNALSNSLDKYEEIGMQGDEIYIKPKISATIPYERRITW